MIYLFLLIIPLLISLLSGNPLIRLLKSLNARQTIREDGPKEHIKKKSQVPTIGGVIFLIPAFLSIFVIFLAKKELQTIDLLIVIGSTFVMAMLGFIDDYLKVMKKHNKGISGWIKLFIQFVVSLVIYYKYNSGIGIVYLIWGFFIIAGASNSYNLTDGLDGLLGSISFISLIGFSFLFYRLGQTELLYFSIVLSGSLLGFLYFNKHPAKVFMGDTGSLALGGAIGSMAMVTHTELYLICFATIPIIEALSVILQVLSCQLSKKFLGEDRRIFKMAPLHHHFELIGWSETQIVSRFILFQLACSGIGIFIVLIT